MYGNQVLYAGGRGAIVVRFVAHSTRNIIRGDGAALKNINLDIESAAMGDNFFVLGGKLRERGFLCQARS